MTKYICNIKGNCQTILKSEKKRSEKQQREGKIYPFECRVPKNIKERQESLPQRSMQRNREKQQNAKDYAKAFDCVDHNKPWKILKDMGIKDHLTCLLRNLYADQEATVRTGHGATHQLQTGKGLCQGCILSP